MKVFIHIITDENGGIIMIYKLNKPDIDTIVDYCDNLKANEKLEIYEFGQNKDLVLHIYKDEDYSNIVTISTFQDGICIDDTVTDGCLYKELIRINNYKDLIYRQENDLCRD